MRFGMGVHTQVVHQEIIMLFYIILDYMKFQAYLLSMHLWMVTIIFYVIIIILFKWGTKMQKLLFNIMEINHIH